MRVLRRWDDAPVLVRRAALGLVLVLAYGTVVHLYQLATSGGEPYPDLPGWLRVYFVSLTALDPLAAVLLALRRRSGVVLTVAVLVSDAAANGWVNYVLAPIPWGRVGHAVITLLAVVSLALAPSLWRCARSNRRSRTR